MIPGLNDIYQMSNSLIGRIVSARDLGKDVDALLRAIFIETQKNLAIIELCGKNSPATSVNLKCEVVSQLTFESYQALFLAGKINNQVFERLQATMEYKEPLTPENGNEILAADTILHAIAFLTVRIHVLQRICGMKNRNTLLKHIRLDVRISNIKEALFAVFSTMRKFEEIYKWYPQ